MSFDGRRVYMAVPHLQLRLKVGWYTRFGVMVEERQEKCLSDQWICKCSFQLFKRIWVSVWAYKGVCVGGGGVSRFWSVENNKGLSGWCSHVRKNEDLSSSSPIEHAEMKGDNYLFGFSFHYPHIVPLSWTVIWWLLSSSRFSKKTWAEYIYGAASLLYTPSMVSCTCGWIPRHFLI